MVMIVKYQGCTFVVLNISGVDVFFKNISGVHYCGCKHIRGPFLWLLTYQGCMFVVVNISGVHVCSCKHIRGACLWL